MRLGYKLCFLPVAIGATLGQATASDYSVDPTIDVSTIVPEDLRMALGSIGKLTAAMTCTGSIVVHPRLVVTSAHCVTRVDGRNADDILFQPSYLPQNHARIYHGHVERIGSARQFAGHTPEDEAKDWAIILLDQSPIGVRPFGLRILRRDDLKRNHGAISLPAYVRDAAGNDGVSIDQDCSIVDIRWDVFIHDCDTSRGSSGAPLLMRTGLRLEVVGINSASLYLLGHNDTPGAFVGAAVRSTSFEASLLSVYDAITAPSTDEVIQ